MKIVNLTPHDIAILDKETLREITRFPVSGRVAQTDVRALGEPWHKYCIENDFIVRIHRVSYGPVTDLPAYQEDVMYIVSPSVAFALLGTRPDLLVPGEKIQGFDASVYGCHSLYLPVSGNSGIITRTCNSCGRTFDTDIKTCLLCR